MTFTYPTQTTTLDFGTIQVKLTYITDLDQLFDELLAKGKDHEDYIDQRIPYWADLWHAALGLSQYLIRTDLITPELDVLEIGCGLGVPGLVATKLGARVCFSDYVPEPLDFLLHNWQQNSEGTLQTLQMDWRKPNLERRPALLLASDVAYEARSFDALLEAFDQLIPPGGRAILSEPGRAIAEPFLDQLRQLPGYVVHEATEKVYWNDFWKTIRVLDLHRTAATH
jgi:predicted nicotinamide N-methyase